MWTIIFRDFSTEKILRNFDLHPSASKRFFRKVVEMLNHIQATSLKAALSFQSKS
jgi:hypothetical protein